ncbi:hypothetical protein S245_044698, partial [Arachis hypogaea]
MIFGVAGIDPERRAELIKMLLDTQVVKTILLEIPSLGRQSDSNCQLVELVSQLGDKRRKIEEDGVGSSCSSIYLCGSPSSGGCYCHGLALEHTLQRWLSLGSYQQKSHIQSLIPLTEFREQVIMKSMESVFLVTLGIALFVLLGLWIHGQIQHLSK